MFHGLFGVAQWERQGNGREKILATVEAPKASETLLQANHAILTLYRYSANQGVNRHLGNG